MNDILDGAATVETGANTTPSKSIIITKSIKSLTSPSSVSTTPANGGALTEKNSENVDSNKKDANSNKSPDGKILTEAEKLELRIKKFGVQSENAKLTQRAERFGGKVEDEVGDKSKMMEKRAARFGITQNSPTTNATANGNGLSAEALEKRAKRFGTPTTTTSPEASSEALTKRKERFGFTAEEAKKKLRSERFENKA